MCRSTRRALRARASEVLVEGKYLQRKYLQIFGLVYLRTRYWSPTPPKEIVNCVSLW